MSLKGRFCRMRTFALYGTVAGLITFGLVLLASPAFYPEPVHRYIPRPKHQPSHGHPGTTKDGQSVWEFDYKRDGRSLSLTESQCEAAFPTLDKEIQRAVEYRKKRGNITVDEVDVKWRDDGIMRAMIKDNRLYILDLLGTQEPMHRPRTLATLQSINRAITAFDGPLPNIEFTFGTHDAALKGEHDTETTWAYTRLAHQESLWLMPDFGFWGWPDVGIRSYSELQNTLENDEDDFLDKIQKIVWRGALAVGSKEVRAGLVEHGMGKPWADIQTLDWANKTDIQTKLLTMEDHCGYMFTAMTEGNTYSGRLKFLVNCHNILVSHDLLWVEHWHHLLHDSGPEQNYVKVERNYADLPEKITNLLKTKNLVKAEHIADRALETFRRRYLTPAAEACYWRSLIRGWASVQGFEPEVWVEGEEENDWRGGRRSKRRPRGTPFEAFMIMEEVDWEMPAKGRKMCLIE